jgi:pathogenesis-related protein 1
MHMQISYKRTKEVRMSAATIAGVGSVYRKEHSMRRFFLAALLIALFSACVSSVGSALAATTGAALSTTEIAQAVSAHNAVRQRVAQSESIRLGRTVRIPNLTWDTTVAAVAQDWANQQAVRMRQGLLPVHRPNNVYGESMYWAWSTPTAPSTSPSVPVQSWASEQRYYNYTTNTCAAGHTCYHYTQLVWSRTTRVGCGRSLWTTADGKHYVLWVCDYAPKGNIYGQRPY